MHLINSAERASTLSEYFYITYDISYINSKNLCQLHINDEKTKISGASVCVHECVFKCKYIYVPAGEGSINLGTSNTPVMTE